MPKSHADRQREHRRRLACGEAVLPVLVNLDRLEEVLVSARLICEGDCDDRSKVAAALSKVVASMLEARDA